MIEVNDRVGIIINTKDSTKECFFLGYGIYEGKYIPSGDNLSKKAKLLSKEKKESCRFKLDDGNIIYATDCWFMFEERFNAVFVNDEYEEGWKIINVDIKGKRREM